MTDDVDVDRSPVPVIVLATAMILTGLVAVLLVDALITGRELRKTARQLRDTTPPPRPPVE